MSLAELIRRNRTAILALTTMLAAAGLLAAWRMPIAIFPEVAFHRVSIIARAGDLPVEQTLTAVTQPLENHLSSVLGIETIRSLTSRGGVELDLIFGWKADMMRAQQLVQVAIDETRGELPAGTEVEARLLDTSAFPIVGVAVTSAQRSLAEISDFVIYEAAPRLRTIDGVYRVELNGAKIREYALTLDPEAMVRHRLDLTAVETAVHDANLIAAGGRVRDGYHLTLAVVRGAGTDPRSLLDVVVAQDGGIPVTLGQVAHIDSVLREDFTRAAANGETAALIGISRQPSGNAVAISRDVRQRVETMAREHPDYHFSIFYDQADLVHEAIGSVRDSIAIGLLLAVATIFFFIAQLRVTFVAAAVIPATVLISCVVLSALGMSFNLMTLGGIAAGIGLILDDAIVVVENFHRHRHGGAAPEQALADSVREIAPALLGSTLTPVAVLLPLSFLSGVPGAFFKPLAVTMSVALLVSLLLALSFTPALASAVEPRRARPPGGGGPGDRLAARLSRSYGRALRWSLGHRWIAAVLVAGAVLLGGWAYSRVETGFVPEMDEGAFVLDYWAPPGTSLQETVRLLGQVDGILRATPEVTSFSRRTGSELGFFLTESNRGDYAVRLKSAPRRPIDEVIDEVRERIHARLPGLRVDFVEVLQDMIGDLSGNPNPIEVKLFGSDQAELQKTARAARRLIASVPGVVDAFDGITPVGNTFEVQVEEAPAKRAGLNAADVQHWLQTAITGTVVGQVLEGDRAIPLRLRYPDRFRSRLAALEEMTVVTPAGHLAPLASLARLHTGPVSVQLAREDLRQLVRVTARLSGRDLGSVTGDVRAALRRSLVLPPGVTREYGGLFASQQRAFGELLLVFLGSLLCVSALLLVEFGSIAAAVAIVLGSSLALCGSLASLWLTHTALNVSSIVGMIMVVGIVAKNGILLLDFARREQRAGADLAEALVRAGSIRLRPILMTSLAAIAGLAPLAFGIGAGGQMQQPLAIAILGGVALSMLFSMIAVPLLYSLLAWPVDAAREAVHAPAGG